MDIVFVTPPVKGYIESPQCGCLSMAGYLRNEGFSVDYVDGDVMGLSHRDLAKHIIHLNPRVIGISATTLSYPSARKVITEIKKQSNVKVVLGGVHATFKPNQCLKENPQLDYVVTGEGFLPIKGILEGKFDTPLIHGEMSIDINSLPLPAWDLVDLNDYRGNFPVLKYPSTTTFSSIGCPMLCSFCSLSYKTPRFRETDILVEELKILIKKGAKEIFLYDDEFNLMAEHALNVCEAIIKAKLHKKLSFKCQMRASERLVTKELLKTMKEANFTVIYWGIESGSQRVLDAIKKHLTVEECERALRLAHRERLSNFGFFMTQNLDETWLEMLKTADFIKTNEKYMKWCQVTIATPYPGSELWDIANREKWVNNLDFSKMFTNRAVMDTPWMTRFEAERARIHLESTFLGGGIMRKFRLYLRRFVPHKVKRTVKRVVW